MSKKGLLEISGDHGAQIWNGSHWFPCSYLDGAPVQTFFVFFAFLVRKTGPLPKIVAQIRRVFGFGGGLPWNPLRPPPSPVPLGKS